MCLHNGQSHSKARLPATNQPLQCWFAYISLPGILADKQQVKVAPAVDVLLTLFSAIPSCLLDVTS